MSALTESIEVLAEIESLAQRVFRQREAEMAQKGAAERERRSREVQSIALRRAREQVRKEIPEPAVPEIHGAAPTPPKRKLAQIKAAAEKVKRHKAAKQTLTHLVPRGRPGAVAFGTRKYKVYTGKGLSDKQRAHNLYTLHNLHRTAADHFRNAASDHPEGSPEWHNLMNRAHHHDSKADHHYQRVQRLHHVA